MRNRTDSIRSGGSDRFGHGDGEKGRAPDEIDGGQCDSKLHCSQPAGCRSISTNRVMIHIDHGT